MADEITLDTFFALAAPIELINLAAQLGTRQTDRSDSVWQGESYGSTLEDLIGRPANAVALRLELQRSLAAVDLAGDVTVDDEITVRTLGAVLFIDADGVTIDAD